MQNPLLWAWSLLSPPRESGLDIVGAFAKGRVIWGMSMIRWAVAVLLAALLALGSGCGSGGATNPLRGRLLSVSDLPSGWSASSANPESVQVADSACFSGTSRNLKGLTYDTAAFVQGTSIPNLGEVVASGPQVQQTWQRLNASLAGCHTATLLLGGTKVQATVRPLALAGVPQISSAYAWNFTFSGIPLGFDLMLFQTGIYAGYVSYADLGTPSITTVTAFVKAAIEKAETGSTAPVPDAVSIISIPVHTVETPLGAVAYRALGTGQPLVMITGYTGTMEAWDRRLVDTLAQNYRVVIFDNAGVGRTQALPGPLTIDAMANQTAALIDALGLKQPDVLGWSMGSMIAQALAVLHPSQVHRLILCASYPGTGAAVPPSRATLNGFESGNPQQVLPDLFPRDQSGAQNSYLAAVSGFPSSAPAPKSVASAQGVAIDQWWAGQDPAGRQAAKIAIPTLIADGSADRLDPLANSNILAQRIPGATLKLYPDAGHAFLFQDQTSFVPLIESFLG